MSGDESSTAFELRELQLLTQLRQHEADEARQAAELAGECAAAQRAVTQARQALERAESERVEQERERAAALAAQQLAELRLALIAHEETERAQAALSLRRLPYEGELARLAGARSRPPWLLRLTKSHFATAAAMALVAWHLQLTTEHQQRALAERLDQYEQDWQTPLRRAEIAAGYAGRVLAGIEFMDEQRKALATLRAMPPHYQPTVPIVRVSVPRPIRIPRECLENPLC